MEREEHEEYFLMFISLNKHKLDKSPESYTQQKWT